MSINFMDMNNSGMDNNNSPMNHDMGMGGMTMTMMPMYFYWDANCIFLFGTWKTEKSDHGYFALGCIIVFIFNIIIQLLPLIQKKMFPRSVGELKGDICHSTEVQNPKILLLNDEAKMQPKKNSEIIIGLLFFFLNVATSALNMLLLMTFNGWVIICCVLGACAGYLINEISIRHKNMHNL